MFRIYKKSGEELGFVDAVRYIKVGVSGDYVQATADEATGVAVNGTAYQLAEVVITEVDGGSVNNRLITEKNQLRADLDYMAMEAGVKLNV